jgi:pyruvate dehydrogenase E1 component beta subunit
MISAIRDNSPVMIFEHRYLGLRARVPVPEESFTLPLGRAQIVREGSDVTLCGIGRMTYVCLDAAETLAAEGLQAEVVDLLSLAPLDETTILESVERTQRLVIVDEDTPACSVARDIAARVADSGFDFLDAPIKTVNSVDAPVPYSAALESVYTPSPEKVVAVVHELLGTNA